MSLYPTGRILIQKANFVPLRVRTTPGVFVDDRMYLPVPQTGLTDFFVLPIADQFSGKPGLVSSCEVEFSTTSDHAAAVSSFEVANLSTEVVRQMADVGYVKIEAGYTGHPTRPMQAIFFGKLNAHEYGLESGKIKWKFTATALPNEIWAIRPNAAAPVDHDKKPMPIFIGEAIRILADRIGIGRANVRLPAVFDGDLSQVSITNQPNLVAQKSTNFRNAITLENWSTTKIAIEELQDLMLRVNLAFKTTFGVVKNYSLLTDVDNPFIIVIGDISVWKGESLHIDLDSAQILTAGPKLSTTTTPATASVEDDADDAAAPASPPQTITTEEFTITSVFDPKVSMGLLVTATSKKLGLEYTFHVEKGKHSLNGSPLRWRTEYRGRIESKVTVNRGS